VKKVSSFGFKATSGGPEQDPKKFAEHQARECDICLPFSGV